MKEAAVGQTKSRTQSRQTRETREAAVAQAPPRPTRNPVGRLSVYSTTTEGGARTAIRDGVPRRQSSGRHLLELSQAKRATNTTAACATLHAMCACFSRLTSGGGFPRPCYKQPSRTRVAAECRAAKPARAQRGAAAVDQGLQHPSTGQCEHSACVSSRAHFRCPQPWHSLRASRCAPMSGGLSAGDKGATL